MDKRVGSLAATKWLLLSAAFTAATALAVRRRARSAEIQHPPTGRFINVAGVKLHFLERGSGTPIVLLHGNGVLERLAAHHRVVASDRPGYGFSERPRNRTWTPEAQADLLRSAFEPAASRMCRGD